MGPPAPLGFWPLDCPEARTFKKPRMLKTVEGGSKYRQIQGRKVRLEASVHPEGCALVFSRAPICGVGESAAFQSAQV